MKTNTWNVGTGYNWLQNLKFVNNISDSLTNNQLNFRNQLNVRIINEFG